MKNKEKYNSKITKDDLEILGDKAGNLRNDGGEDRILKKRKKKVDFEGEDLDVPGRKSPKNTLKDEENQLYSLGDE